VTLCMCICVCSTGCRPGWVKCVGQISCMTNKDLLLLLFPPYFLSFLLKCWWFLTFCSFNVEFTFALTLQWIPHKCLSSLCNKGSYICCAVFIINSTPVTSTHFLSVTQRALGQLSRYWADVDQLTNCTHIHILSRTSCTVYPCHSLLLNQIVSGNLTYIFGW